MSTTYVFTGRTRAGEAVGGERVAETVDAAVAALRRDQILVTKIQASKATRSSTERRPGKLGKTVGTKTLAVFTRQFSVMIDAGLPLVECLGILSRQELLSACLALPAHMKVYRLVKDLSSMMEVAMFHS